MKEATRSSLPIKESHQIDTPTSSTYILLDSS